MGRYGKREGSRRSRRESFPRVADAFAATPGLNLAKGSIVELERACVRYEKQRIGLGERFLDAVIQTATRVVTAPFSGQMTPENPTMRRMLVPDFPYQLVYRLAGDLVRLISVSHLHRRPGHWKNRR